MNFKQREQIEMMVLNHIDSLTVGDTINYNSNNYRIEKCDIKKCDKLGMDCFNYQTGETETINYDEYFVSYYETLLDTKKYNF